MKEAIFKQTKKINKNSFFIKFETSFQQIELVQISKIK